MEMCLAEMARPKLISAPADGDRADLPEGARDDYMGACDLKMVRPEPMDRTPLCPNPCAVALALLWMDSHHSGLRVLPRQQQKQPGGAGRAARSAGPGQCEAQRSDACGARGCRVVARRAGRPAMGWLAAQAASGPRALYLCICRRPCANV